MFMGIIAKFAGGALKILGASVPIPVFVLLGVFLWTKYDKASYAAQVRDKAIERLVHGEELAAANAKIEGMQKLLRAQEEIAEIQRQRAEHVQRLNENFLKELTLAELETMELQNDNKELRSRPAPVGCVVDDFLWNRLRNK